MVGSVREDTGGFPMLGGETGAAPVTGCRVVNWPGRLFSPGGGPASCSPNTIRVQVTHLTGIGGPDDCPSELTPPVRPSAKVWANVCLEYPWKYGQRHGMRVPDAVG